MDTNKTNVPRHEQRTRQGWTIQGKYSLDTIQKTCILSPLSIFSGYLYLRNHLFRYQHVGSSTLRSRPTIPKKEKKK